MDNQSVFANSVATVPVAQIVPSILETALYTFYTLAIRDLIDKDTLVLAVREDVCLYCYFVSCNFKQYHVNPIALTPASANGADPDQPVSK